MCLDTLSNLRDFRLYVYVKELFSVSWKTFQVVEHFLPIYVLRFVT